MQITGLWVPVVMPFRDGAVDIGSLTRLCEHLLGQGVDGLVACGSTGEVASLTESEYAAVVSAVASVCPQAAAGVVDSATGAAIRRAALAADSGAAAVLVLTPTLLGAAPAEVSQHYRAVAAGQPLPVYIYNFPARTGISLSAGQILELAAEPNIHGIKQSVPLIDRTFQQVAIGAPASFSTLTGNAEVFWPALAIGARGGILAAANLFPAELGSVWSASQHGGSRGRPAVPSAAVAEAAGQRRHRHHQGRPRGGRSYRDRGGTAPAVGPARLAGQSVPDQRLRRPDYRVERAAARVPPL
jgi:4-hydroxy-tetrahydrodipicolinate synthase